MNLNDEWLETDGLGGFASGTVGGVRTRRYHALLLSATTPPTGRVVLVNGLDAWIECPGGKFPLSAQRYAPDIIEPDVRGKIAEFQSEPWPRWRFELEAGRGVELEVLMRKETPAVFLTWRLTKKQPNVELVVRPFLSGRDYHALHRENPAFNFEPERQDERLTWRPYPGVPGIVAHANGSYEHHPDWYRNFFYEEEAARGLDHVEDLASPGTFRFSLSKGEAVLIFALEGSTDVDEAVRNPLPAAVKKLRTGERLRRGRLGGTLGRAADAYLVRRGDGKSIVAGYPWFTDWGRDTFIALRGLCLATGKLDPARDILLTWAGMVSGGMLPNRFPDHDEPPEYNAVDASLWFIIAVYEFVQAMQQRKKRIKKADQNTLREAIDAILEGYARGTRFGIAAGDDGLLSAGAPGATPAVALTWMDARVDGQPVAERAGKPVEIQALWLNALWTRRDSERWADLFERGLNSFRARFWNAEAGCLYDVIDCNHQPGAVDASLRPNQIFAVGGLPLALLEGEEAREVVKIVEERLWTPRGLRTLAPDSPGYAPRFEGGPRERDRAYHEGTVWPWLLGPFVEAWVRVHANSAKARKEARRRFLDPLLEDLNGFGLGHLAEVADGDPPHTPRGCPFQAWSVGEALRLDRVVLRE